MLIVNVAMMIVLCCASVAVTPTWAQNSPAIKEEKTLPAQDSKEKNKTAIELPSVKPEENKNKSFLDIFNNKAYAAPVDKDEEKNKLRKDWEDLTGVDVFYPYFKAREIEDWVGEKTKVKFLKMRGKLRLSEKNNQIKYTFSIKF